MYLLTGYHPFAGEDTRYFTDNERETAVAIAHRWYYLKRYPTLYHYGDKPEVVFSWRESRQGKAA